MVDVRARMKPTGNLCLVAVEYTVMGSSRKRRDNNSRSEERGEENTAYSATLGFDCPGFTLNCPYTESVHTQCLSIHNVWQYTMSGHTLTALSANANMILFDSRSCMEGDSSRIPFLESSAVTGQWPNVESTVTQNLSYSRKGLKPFFVLYPIVANDGSWEGERVSFPVVVCRLI